MNINEFRDIFWPLIDKEEVEIKDLAQKKIKCDLIKEGEEDYVLKHALECFENE